MPITEKLYVWMGLGNADDGQLRYTDTDWGTGVSGYSVSSMIEPNQGPFRRHGLE